MHARSFFAVMSLIAATGGANAAPGADIAEWTIMVFLNGDNNLEPFGLQDFREMASVGSTPEVNIVVQFDRTPGFSSGAGDWTQALRFLVQKDMTPLPANAVQDIGEVNMGDGRTLADFVSWARAAHPAKRYMLDIWNHGQGWRFYQLVRADSIFPYAAARMERPGLERRFQEYRTARATAIPRSAAAFTPVIPADMVSGATVRYVSSDDTSGDFLYNREIQETLTTVLGGDRIDVIGFDACLMAMAETGYAMRDVAHVMVASEELEPGDGWAYDAFLATIVAAPAMTSDALATHLVKSYEDHYAGIDETTTLSAVDLDNMSTLASSVTRFADECSLHLGSDLPMLKAARDACEAYAPGYGLNGIDLDDFCEEIISRTTDTKLRDAAAEVRRNIDATVIANYAGSERQGAFGSNGVAIYYPATKALFDHDPDSEGYLETNINYPVQFVQQHRWDNFLHAYFAVVP